MAVTISVLITYCGEKELLRDSLRSLARQDPAVHEVLVYDDASLSPAEGYLVPELPVKVLRGEKRIGPSAARNILLRASTGEAVHFHDADDLFCAEWSRMVQDAFARGAEVVFSESYAERDGVLYSKALIEFSDAPKNISSDLLKVCLRYIMITSCGVYSRRLAVEAGGFRESLEYAEDYDFNVRIAAMKPSFLLIPEPLVVKRVRTDSYGSDRPRNHEWMVQVLEMLSRELPLEYRGEIAYVANRIGADMLGAGDESLARRAFALGRTLGPASEPYGDSWFKRLLVRCLGQETAEHISLWYRRIVPPGIRGKVRQTG
jgi:glycosyltransferase involved in cell wall biosynthesis